MAIPLQTKAAPALKLPTIGDSVVVAIAYEEQVPLYKYRKDGGPKVRATTQDGKERNQLRLTVVVMSGKAIAGEASEPVPVGEEAVIFLAGHNWFSYIEASKKLGGINVGDVLQWKYDRDEPGQGAEDKKMRVSTLRHAKPDEAETVARCEAIYRRITSTPLAPAAPAADC
jgi:hypothetical protein